MDDQRVGLAAVALRHESDDDHVVAARQDLVYVAGDP